jgi:hypothetical protein
MNAPDFAGLVTAVCDPAFAAEWDHEIRSGQCQLPTTWPF